MRRALILVLPLILATCNEGDLLVDTGSTTLPVTVELHVGQTIRFTEQHIALRFDHVTADSRCPKGLMCFWEGDAGVRLNVRPEGGTATDCTLHTTLDPKTVTADPLAITLKSLNPYPERGSTIGTNEYVVTLAVDSVKLVLWEERSSR